MPSMVLSDFSPLFDRASPELPGIPKGHLKKISQDVFSELCLEGWVWNEEISLSITDSIEYDLELPQENTLVVGVLNVGNLIKDDDYQVTSNNTLKIEPGKISGELLVTCIVMPTFAFAGIPVDLEARYMACLELGVKAKAMLELDKPWSSPQMGSRYDALWQQELISIKSNVKEGFTVTRHGRSHRPQSYYL